MRQLTHQFYVKLGILLISTCLGMVLLPNHDISAATESSSSHNPVLIQRSWWDFLTSWMPDWVKKAPDWLQNIFNRNSNQIAQLSKAQQSSLINQMSAAKTSSEANEILQKTLDKENNTQTSGVNTVITTTPPQVTAVPSFTFTPAVVSSSPQKLSLVNDSKDSENHTLVVTGNSGSTSYIVASLTDFTSRKGSFKADLTLDHTILRSAADSRQLATTVNSSKNKSFHLSLESATLEIPAIRYAGDYSATITYTLTNGPEN